MHLIKRPAFTLVELLVVIAIIGLLSTVAVVATNGAKINSRNAKRKADLIQLSKALELYYADNNSYPSTAGVPFGVCSNWGSKTDSGAGGWIPNLAPAYLAALPRDPMSGKSDGNMCSTPAETCYIYISNAAATEYKLLAHCSVEDGPIPTTDPFNDPARSTQDYAVWSSGGRGL